MMNVLRDSSGNLDMPPAITRNPSKPVHPHYVKEHYDIKRYDIKIFDILAMF